MNSLKSYWDESYERPNLQPTYDDWLNKYYNDINNNIDKKRIVDLGCGIGNNALYLYEKGISSIACDISEVAIKKVNDVLPNIETKCFDMTEGLPFKQSSVKVVIADLSLHYFTEEITIKIINNIHEILDEDGLLLCRLNSINEINNKGDMEQTREKNLYKKKDIFRRFFNREEIDRFFTKKMWIFQNIQEYEMKRYKNNKILWEIAMKRRHIV